MLWLALLNLSVVTYTIEMYPDGERVFFWLVAGLSTLNTLSWAIWRFAASRMSWLQTHWPPRLLIVTALICAILPITGLIFEINEALSAGIICAFILFGVLGITANMAREEHGDLFEPTAAAGALLIPANILLGRVLFDSLDLGALGFIMMAFVLLIQAAVIIRALLTLQQIAEEAS